MAMTNTAEEVMSAMNIDVSSASLDLTCMFAMKMIIRIYQYRRLDGNPDGKRDQYLNSCPGVLCPLSEYRSYAEAAKKLVWIEATQAAPLYFLSLTGI